MKVIIRLLIIWIESQSDKANEGGNDVSKRGKNKETVDSKESQNKDIINFANYIFEQVKTQQETRDKWMEIFLSIVGGVATFATFTMAFFTQTIGLAELYLILGAIFALTGVLGIVFYLLFMTQRVNYKLHYKVLNEIQKIIITEYLSNPYDVYYPTNRSPFKKFKKGADFYASIIQNMIIVVCFVLSSLFFLLSLNIAHKNIAIICILIALVVEVGLRVLYNLYEKIV